jgi:hypothetical protein
MLELPVEGYVLIDNCWDNIKMALKEVWCYDILWIQLEEDMAQLRALFQV